MSGPLDRWAEGANYEAFMGRWSRQLAPLYVSWLAVPRGADWLDVGCGTGALTTAISRYAQPRSVTGCDPSRAFIDHARSGARDTAVSFVVAATGGLPARDGGYGCIASLLALNFFPDRAAALREMRGLAAPGGTVSACVWDYPGRMDILRYFWDAACALDPQARSRHEAERFAFCEPIALTGVFRQAGLREVCCEAIDIPTPCASVDDYWRPFLAGAGPAGAYVQGLSEPQREALARRLTRSLPRDAEGRVPLAARAWVVRGAV